MTRRLAFYIVAVLCVVMVGLVLWRVLTEPGRQKVIAAQAQASQTVAEGQVAAGRDAVAIVTENAAHGAEIDRQTQENRDAILNAPGASVRVDPGLDAATRRAICLRPSARHDPACVAVLHPRPD